MLVEQVPSCIFAHEDCAGITVVEHSRSVIENAPARDHVLFIAVVLDMGDAGRGCRRKAEAGVVEVGRGRSKGVNFLHAEWD